MSEPFIAEVRIFPFNFAPRGWAFCDGQLLPIAQNTALFSLIGTTYGGDGRTTTGLPNLQGRTAMHSGNGPGLTPRSLGQRAGADTVQLSLAQIPQHNHLLRARAAAGDASDPANQVPAGAKDDGTGSPVNSPYTNEAADTFLDANALATVGGDQAHDNTMPSLVFNFCIALQGLFPSRN
ncbi:MAG: tail fiber protein [Bacteroidota bacterium]